MSRPRPSSIAALAAVLAAIAFSPAVAQAAPCDAPVTNEIACENSKPGNADWTINNSGDGTLQGFATATSVNRGGSISFKIDTTAPGYTIDVYRIGYYGGAGARRVVTNLSHAAPQNQPACQTFPATGLIDCGNWSVAATWNVPSAAVSGLYIARLRRTDNGGDSHITFVVRNDASQSDVMLQTSDATWQAYNVYGGNSTYRCAVACPPEAPNAYKGAYEVSYNRPYVTAGESTQSWWLSSEYPMIRYLEANGYDLTYASSVDTHARGALIRNHRMFMSSGHDEYWSGSQRANVEAARDSGVNLAFFSGNEVFWRTGWKDSTLGTDKSNRTIVSYKDTHFEAQLNPTEWTGTWRDPRFAAPPQGGSPENALTGTSTMTINSRGVDMTVSSAFKDLRLWRNTAVANLTAGQSLRLAPESLSYEWDEDPDNGSRPAGQIKLSSTTVTGAEKFVDHGTYTDVGTATHSLVMHRRPNGALVFGAGAVQWSWGLDSDNPNGNTPDRTMQQATMNLLAEMDAQPYAPIAGLARATKSTDTTAPTATIGAPAANATLVDGVRTTITGTAADAGGGVVAGVEVSTDDGQTWHPATGTTSWSYSWIAHGNPSTKLRVRATDDSVNIQTSSTPVTVNVSCPCSIWGDNVAPKPANVDGGDPSPIELGVKFKSDSYGAISGVRFYKSAANTGTHTGSLWTAGGTRLAQATFTSETGSGWQTVTFAQPVQVQPGSTYVASYYAPNGRYSATKDYMYPGSSPGPHELSTLKTKPLSAIENFGSVKNGLYAYGPSSTFPTGSFSGTNYWVDVVFSPTPPPGPTTGVSAVAAGMTSATVRWTPPTTGGAPSSYRITPYLGSVAQTATTVPAPATSTTIAGLTRGATYRFTVEALNPAGAGPASAQSNAVTPNDPVAPTAPRDVVARPATTAALVEWTAPMGDGDSPITGYTITPFAGSVAETPVQVSASTRSRTVTGLTNGTAYSFRVVATNAIGDGTPSDPSNVATPQNTIFEFGAPSILDGGDTSAVELGVKFRADVAGTVTGVRFYKAATNTGTHAGSLWSAGGTRLAQATFTGESASGWQAVTFATPVAVTAGTTYVASYHAPGGRYSITPEGLTGGAVNSPLRAQANTDADPNGVYMYGAASTFPSRSYNAGNYGVDVLFSVPKPGATGTPTAAESGATSAKVTWTAPTAGGGVTAYRITPYVGAAAQPATTITGSPPSLSKKITGLTTGTSYRFTVQALNASGGGPISAQSNAVTPTQALPPGAPTDVVVRPATRSAQVSWSTPEDDGESPITGYTITPLISGVAQDPVAVPAGTTSRTVTALTNGTPYAFRVRAVNAVGTGPNSVTSAEVTPAYTIFDFAQPSIVDAGDPNAIEVGVKFRADRNGTVSGVRFYKSAANTGTHIGSLWSAAGTRLAQATSTGESASGWQTATFATPVAITAGTTYVASYHAPGGHYSVTPGGLAGGSYNAPLRALADTSAEENGVYVYGGTSSFPNRSYNAGEYGVDVTFLGDAIPGAPSGVTATAREAGAAVSWNAPSTGGPVASYEVVPYIGATAQTPKDVTGTPAPTSTVVSGLTAGTAYTFRVRAVGAEGTGPLSGASTAVTPTGATVPAAPTAVAAEGDARAAVVRWTAPDDGGSAILNYTLTPYIAGAPQTPTTVPAPTERATINGLTPGTSYTFRVRATNAVGAGATSAASSAATPLRSIFDFATPAVPDAGDPNAIALGVRFQSSSSGAIRGIRFYKAPTNTGTHTGTLWDASGLLLAQSTFTGESASGWQSMLFSTPVPITADTVYVASYHAPNGHYAATSRAFDGTAISNPPLTALADGTAGNGRYSYSSTPVFPTNSFNAGNYWVDVLFDGP